MKKLIFLLMTCGTHVCSLSQTEIAGKNIISSDKYEITPIKGLKKGMGRLNLNFPEGVEWSVDVYNASSKFITNFSIIDQRNFGDKKNYQDLAAGLYHFKVNTVLVENVPIEEGKETKLRTGVLDITNAGNWELRSEDKKKYLTSGNKAKNLVLPVGNYQLGEGSVYKLVKVIASEQFNPEILVHDQYEITPISSDSDTDVANKGRLKFNLTSYDYWSPGEGYEFRPRIVNESGVEMHSCHPGGPGFCTHSIYLDEGTYTVLANWAGAYGYYEPKSPIRILKVPVKKGFETKIKIGFLRNLTRGDFELLDESKELIHCLYANLGTSKRPLPVGKYFIRQPGIGIFPIEIEDGKEDSLNTIRTSSKNDAAIFRISPKILKDIKISMGRLNCDFPNADFVPYLLSIPNANGTSSAILLDSVKSIDLLPGNYELKFGDFTLPFQIEKQRETKIIHGYLKTPFNNKICDPVRGGCAMILFTSKTIPVRPGYYYVNLGGSPMRQILIRVAEGEIVDYNDFKLVN